ncbi:MAG: DEAD/DEAH box helicase, partial [Waterburya sp.]
VVFDEAHHCKSKSYSQIFRHYSQQGSYILGVTATPCTSDGKRGLGKLFNNCPGFEALVQNTSVKELTEAKYLADFSLFAPQKILNASEAKIKVVGGDYNQRDVAEFVEENLILGDVIKTWQRHAQGKRTVIFAVSVKHSKLLAKEFRKAGITAAHLDGNSKPSYRQKVLKAFALGKILVLCQHSLVTEGLDIQGIEAIQFLRPTRSIVFWWQAIGRALRFALDKIAIIIDHTDSHRHLPWPNQVINWQLDTNQPLEQKPTGKCPDCGRLLQLSTDLLQKTRPYFYCLECESRLEIIKPQKNKKNSTIKLIKVIEAEFAQVTAQTTPTQTEPEAQSINDWLLGSFDTDEDELNTSSQATSTSSYSDIFSAMQDLFAWPKTPSTSQGKPDQQHIPNDCD